MTDAFVRFMVSPSGRATRGVAGLGLIAWGLSRRESPAGTTTAVLGLVPLAAGALDVCAIGPVLGAPLSGAAARRALG